MEKQLNKTFSALSDPTRRNMLSLLVERDMPVTEIAERFPLTLAGASKHLSILTRAGLISRRRRGREVWCRIEPGGLRDAFFWMQSFGHFEASAFDALESVLDGLAATPEDLDRR